MKTKRFLKYLLFVCGLLSAAFFCITSCSADPNRSLKIIQTPTPEHFPSHEHCLSVVTYNVQARPLLDRCTWKTPLIGERLMPYDIIGLQEIFLGYSGLFRKGREHGGVYFSKRRHFLKLVNSGLAVLTKYPLVFARAEYFENEGSLENRLGSKGLLFTRIQIRDSFLDFYTTHLAAGVPADSGAARHSELKQITRFIHENSPPENAVIICGDFNLTMFVKDNGLPAFLQENALRDPAQELKVPGKTFIDHIFYRDGTKLKLQADSLSSLKDEFTIIPQGALSDHHPLKVEFRLSFTNPKSE